MARKKRMEISALNIAMSGPHQPQEYVDLFKEATKGDAPHKYYGNQSAAFWGVHMAQDPLKAINGMLCRSFDLSRINHWLNTETKEYVPSESIVDSNVISKMSPDFAITHFVFDPSRHLLFFQSKTPNRSSLQKECGISLIEL